MNLLSLTANGDGLFVIDMAKATDLDRNPSLLFYLFTNDIRGTHVRISVALGRVYRRCSLSGPSSRFVSLLNVVDLDRNQSPLFYLFNNDIRGIYQRSNIGVHPSRYRSRCRLLLGLGRVRRCTRRGVSSSFAWLITSLRLWPLGGGGYIFLGPNLNERRSTMGPGQV